MAGVGSLTRITDHACGTASRLTGDVVVIGAGIVGAACAHALINAGLDVHLVEREAPARGASGACEGNLVLWDRPTVADLRLARRSHQRWAELAVELLDETGIDIEFDRKGSLMIATDEANADAARGKCAWLAEQGVGFEWLDRIRAPRGGARPAQRGRHRSRLLPAGRPDRAAPGDGRARDRRAATRGHRACP